MGDSLAEMIRAALTPEYRQKLLDQALLLACEPHDDPHARLKAMEFIAKHGWPDEAKGTTTIKTEGGTTTVTHVHQP